MEKKNGVLFPFFLTLFGVFLLVESFYIPPSFYQQIGAEVYSRIIAGILIVTGVYNLFAERRSLAALIRGIFRGERGKLSLSPTDNRANFLLALFFVILPLYALSASTVGYFVSTAAFLILSMAFIAENWRAKLWIILSLSLGLTVLMYFAFDIFKIYLPESLLI